jgi:hypothetical protein
MIVFWVGFFRGWSDLARDTQLNDVCLRLSMNIETFRGEEGRYPQSLSELESANYQSDFEKEATQRLFNVIRHNEWHDVYDYYPSTNGFTIIVTGPEYGLFGSSSTQRRIEKDYKTQQSNSPRQQ